MSKKGFALIGAIFVLIVFSVLGLVAVSLLSGENISALRDYNSIRAFHLAEAGLRYTIAYQLAPDANWSDNIGFSRNVFPGNFTVAYTYRSVRRCIIRFTGNVGGISRSIIVDIKRTGMPGPFSYAIYANNPESKTLYIQNSSTVYGDFYYDGPVVMQNSSKLLNGTMYSDSVQLQHSSYVASWEPIDNPVPPPVFDPAYYNTILSETTKSDTSALNLSGRSVLNLSGQTLYYTSINIANSAKIIGPGTLVATTGNFSLSNSSQIGDNVTVIVKGSATFSNSSKVGTDFNLISYGNIAVNNSQNMPAEALLFSYGNVTFNNSSQFWGSVLAPSGEVSSVNSTTFNGILYGDTINLQNSTHLNGSAVVEQVGYFTNSTVVTYDPSKFPSTIPEGFEGGGGGSEAGISITNWEEAY